MTAKVKWDSIDNYKSWVLNFPVGFTIYRGQTEFKVASAGIDFLILKNVSDGKEQRVSRNTEESLEYSPRSRP